MKNNYNELQIIRNEQKIVAETISNIMNEI